VNSFKGKKTKNPLALPPDPAPVTISPADLSVAATTIMRKQKRQKGPHLNSIGGETITASAPSVCARRPLQPHMNVVSRVAMPVRLGLPVGHMSSRARARQSLRLIVVLDC